MLGCRLRRIMSSSSELFGWAQTDKWTEQKSAALCDVCETFNTCMLTHTSIIISPHAVSSHSGFVATHILSLMYWQMLLVCPFSYAKLF